ncbi:MAG: Spy/CpxP family protein refolding chaperone [Rhodomicrobium sp.]
MSKPLLTITAGCLAIGALFPEPHTFAAGRGIGGGFGGGHIGGIGGGVIGRPPAIGGIGGCFHGGGIGPAIPRIGVPQGPRLGATPQIGGLYTSPMGAYPRGLRGLRHGRIGVNHGLGLHGYQAHRLAGVHNPRIRGQNSTGLAGRTALQRQRINRFGAGHNRRSVLPHAALAAAAIPHANAFDNARWGGHREGHHNHRFRHFWAGGVFWPYFFGDFFSYAFWPSAYDGLFWGYGPDALLWSAFWPGYEYPYLDYGYYATPASGEYSEEEIYGGIRSSTVPLPLFPLPSNEAAGSCAGFAPGVSELPIMQMEAIIRPTSAQRPAFEQLRSALIQARQMLNRACPAQTPATPVARIDAMAQRLQAIHEAIMAVRGPLERLYSELNDSQRKRLERAAQGGRNHQDFDVAKLCSRQAGFVNVPVNSITQLVKLDSPQREALDELTRASQTAAQNLEKSCPSSVPNTITARIDAAEKRVEALIEAIGIIRPKLENFYASLTDAQRDALNTGMPQATAAATR